MRTLAVIGLTVAMAFMASAASAVTTINLDYVGGSTAGAAVGNSVLANTSDVLTFNINVQVDAAGIAGLGFDLRWDNDAAFTVDSVAWQTGAKFTSFTPVTQITLLAPTGNNVLGNGSTQIRNIGWFGLPPSPVSTNVFLGTISFHVGGGTTNLAAGFFSTDGSSATNAAATFITPNFSSFTVNPVPEPGIAALMGLGLAGLALAGRRSKK